MCWSSGGPGELREQEIEQVGGSHPAVNLEKGMRGPSTCTPILVLLLG